MNKRNITTKTLFAYKFYFDKQIYKTNKYYLSFFFLFFSFCDKFREKKYFLLFNRTKKKLKKTFEFFVHCLHF